MDFYAWSEIVVDRACRNDKCLSRVFIPIREKIEYFIEKSIELNNKSSWAMKNQDKGLTKSLIDKLNNNDLGSSI